MAAPESNGICPKPSSQLGDVLYARPWDPMILAPDKGFYQNFTVQIADYIAKGDL